jgi:hypothetical protein
MSSNLYRVILPSGDTSKPYTKEQIATAFNARKIPPESRVQVGDQVLRIDQFLEGKIDPVATEQQRNFARSLGIECPPDITRSAISALIGKAVAEKNLAAVSSDTDSEISTTTVMKTATAEGTAPAAGAVSQRGALYEQVREEILTEMRLTGDIPLSKATPEDVARHFNDVRNLNMVVIYSENNAFETLIAAADSGDRGECEGAMLAFGLPEAMPRSDLRDLLIAVMWGLDI